MTDGEVARRVAAALLAPLTLFAGYLLLSVRYIRSDEGHWEKFFPGMFFFALACSYIFFAFIGVLASIARLIIKAPLRAWVVIGLFATTAFLLTAIRMLLIDEVQVAGFVAALLAILTIPQSVAYCLIAGIPWRAVTIAAA